jgi:hypothetical protein
MGRGWKVGALAAGAMSIATNHPLPELIVKLIPSVPVVPKEPFVSAYPSEFATARKVKAPAPVPFPCVPASERKPPIPHVSATVEVISTFTGDVAVFSIFPGVPFTGVVWSTPV